MINNINTKVRSLKMRTEIPELKRCCICIPLRYGLLAWGYFKLVLNLAAIILFSITFYIIIALTVMFRAPKAAASYITVACLILALMIADTVLHVAFIVGAHRKSVKLLRVYYFYSMVLLVLTTLLVILGMTMTAQTDYYRDHHVGLTVADLAMVFVYLVVHIYVLIVIRSEINKLNNIGDFRFVNNAANAECTLNYYDGEKGTGDENTEEKNETEDNNNIEASETANGNFESETLVSSKVVKS